MTTTAAAGHSGTKDFHQVQFASRILSVRPTDANAIGGVVSIAANIIGGGGVGIVSGGEGVNKTGKISNNTNTNNKNRIGQPMKDQLPVLKPDTLLNDTGIFTVYCFVKDFIGASGTSAVAIDNKIEQAMDLVKSHLMIAVREEVEVLKEKISELMDKINQLEVENTILKANMSQETLHQLQLQAQLQIAGTGTGNLIAQQPQQQTPQQQQQQQPPQQQQQPTTQQTQQPSQQQTQQQQAPQANPANATNGPMS